LKKTYLNLGCGERFHADWINIDLVPRGPGVLAHDLSTGIPFAEASVDAVYNAAVLEHIRRNDVPNFLREIYRVLKPGGIVRIGVPDLETICRLYLQKLASALAGEQGAAQDYDWLMIEMLDQMVREKSGGEMLDYLRQNPLANEQFVYHRIGNEGRELVKNLRGEPLGRRFFHYRELCSALRKLRGRLLMLLAGRSAARAFALGTFRLSGEVHQWMYDRFSLGRALQAAGFFQPITRAANESAIPDWLRFHLDANPDGTVIKPDLFFMEAVKPEG
jgi:predicted SAM-dependent methyltransferase